MDVLGEGVLKHVACEVTVDGTPAEASPVVLVLLLATMTCAERPRRDATAAGPPDRPELTLTGLALRVRPQRYLP